MIVYKFGGATTRTKRGLEALVDLAREAHLREISKKRRSTKSEQSGVVLVISAIGHTTRQLLRCAELSEQGHLDQAEEFLLRTLAQHQQLAASLRLESYDEVLANFESIAADVRARMQGIAITRELSLRSRDQIVSNGERFAATLIETLLRERGLPVRFVDARELIITDENFGHAEPLYEEIEERVQNTLKPRLRRAEIVLTQGFVGATRDGLTTTMGSESSDLTATLLCAALGAEEVVVWKTVPGIFTADPEIVPPAKLIKLLSFEEAEELGRRGARILFPALAHPLLRKGGESVLRVASPTGRGARSTTLQRKISSSAKLDRPLAIALDQHLVQIRLRPLAQEKDLRQLTSQTRRKRQLAQEAIATASHSWSTAFETVLLIQKDRKDALLAALDKEQFAVIEEPAVSVLSLVIRRSTYASVRSSFETQVIRSLRRFQITSLIGVERSIVVVLPEAEAIPALKKLHHDLFEA